MALWPPPFTLTASYLMQNASFFATYIYNRVEITIYDTADNPKGIDTAATDCVANIWFNWEFMARFQSIKQQGFIVCHEVDHGVKGHGDMRRRATDRGYLPSSDGKRQLPYDEADPRLHRCLWLAMDARINGDLVTMPCLEMPFDRETRKPAGVLYPWVTLDMDVLAIYERLLIENPPPPRGRGHGPLPPPEGNGGSGGQSPRPSERNEDHVEGSFDTHLLPALPESESDKEARRQAIATAIAHAQMAGKVPGFMQRSLDTLNKPKVSWVDELREFLVRTTGGDETDWSRMNRKYFLLTHGIAPRRKSSKCGTIAFIVDTSGSTRKIIPQFISEISSLVEEAKPERVVVVWCDAMVHHVDDLSDVEATDISKLTIHGGGGTNLVEGFDWLGDPENAIDDIAAVVVLTDSFTPWGDNPGCPVIVATDHPELDHPKWVRTVSIK